MKGPDDAPPVTPYERYLTQGSHMARWVCPRCQGDNASQVQAEDPTPCVCRVCHNAIFVEPEASRIRLRWRFGEFYKVVERLDGN